MNATSKQVSVEISDYDNKIDFLNSREFQTGKNTVARFDFVKSSAKIGEYSLKFDEGSFVCNDDAIGSARYIGYINGQEVRIDVLKNGFCVEGRNSKGEIIARDQFDANGNCIFTEQQ